MRILDKKKTSKATAFTNLDNILKNGNDKKTNI